MTGLTGVAHLPEAVAQAEAKGVRRAGQCQQQRKSEKIAGHGLAITAILSPGETPITLGVIAASGILALVAVGLPVPTT